MGTSCNTRIKQTSAKRGLEKKEKKPGNSIRKKKKKLAEETVLKKKAGHGGTCPWGQVKPYKRGLQGDEMGVSRGGEGEQDSRDGWGSIEADRKRDRGRRGKRGAKRH